MSKHTKAPWKAESYDGKSWRVTSENMPTYREVWPKCSDPVEAKIYVCAFRHVDSEADGKQILIAANKANAQLIAAAPDLLAALKAVMPYVDLQHISPTIIMAEAAIAKAEGKNENNGMDKA